jgi:hypothetical protein
VKANEEVDFSLARNGFSDQFSRNGDGMQTQGAGKTSSQGGDETR